MFRGLSEDQVSVLYQISHLDKGGYRYFKLDSKEYSLFPYEQEVLLRTGLKFNIFDISE